jgi:hypothetical protein
MSDNPKMGPGEVSQRAIGPLALVGEAVSRFTEAATPLAKAAVLGALYLKSLNGPLSAQETLLGASVGLNDPSFLKLVEPELEALKDQASKGVGKKIFDKFADRDLADFFLKNDNYEFFAAVLDDRRVGKLGSPDNVADQEVKAAARIVHEMSLKLSGSSSP